MNWTWLITEAKIRKRQNRLGFIIALGIEVARRRGQSDVVEKLSGVIKELQECRRAEPDTLCQEDWPMTHRKFVHEHRSELASYWNLDTRIKLDDLVFALG
jgi:hypothetical protein